LHQSRNAWLSQLMELKKPYGALLRNPMRQLSRAALPDQQEVRIAGAVA